MEKLNIAELLKDCPKGMELDCTMFNNATFVRVDNNREQLPIEIAVGGRHSKYLTEEGCFHDSKLLPEAKCVIFPKGKTTWEGFQRPFKDGDILTTILGNTFILKEPNVNSFYYSCYVAIDTLSNITKSYTQFCSKKDCRFATEEEKQKLFDAIKDNGYKWNEEEKKLEKLPRFKVGNKVRHKNNHNVIFTITNIEEDSYVCGANLIFEFNNQDQYELVPDKFDISTLVSFESRVLVRSSDGNLWKPAIFGFSYSSGCYVVGGGYWKQYIPYDVNKELLGTTDNCDEYYKTWE